MGKVSLVDDGKGVKCVYVCEGGHGSLCVVRMMMGLLGEAWGLDDELGAKFGYPIELGS